MGEEESQCGGVGDGGAVGSLEEKGGGKGDVMITVWCIWIVVLRLEDLVYTRRILYVRALKGEREREREIGRPVDG